MKSHFISQALKELDELENDPNNNSMNWIIGKLGKAIVFSLLAIAISTGIRGEEE